MWIFICSIINASIGVAWYIIAERRKNQIKIQKQYIEWLQFQIEHYERREVQLKSRYVDLMQEVMWRQSGRSLYYDN